MNPRPSQGIHHITAIATDPQRNLDFYAGLLGMRLVKKTVNFDDPGTYHLYFGDEAGRPGTILTFFPWPGARRGRLGSGQATTTGFSVPKGSLNAWSERLTDAGVPHDDPVDRFGSPALRFRDPDGLQLELVESERAARAPAWEGGPLPPTLAIRGFHGVTLTERSAEGTAELLTAAFGAETVGEKGSRRRFRLGDEFGGFVDLLTKPDEPWGSVAAGSVHHVAFRVATDDDQEKLRDRLVDRDLRVTSVLDRQYFHSIYFREPGGVLFEVATDPPGFTLDEKLDELGTGLRLPPWLEGERQRIEARLPRLETTAGAAS